MKKLTIKEIKEAIYTDLSNKLDIKDTQNKKVLDVLSSVLAVQFKMCYLYGDDIKNNIFPDTADSVEMGGELERMGRIYLNRSPSAPTPTILKVQAKTQLGVDFKSGLSFKSNEDSKNPDNVFIIENSFTSESISPVFNIVSVESGILTSLSVGDSLMITEPIINTEQNVKVVSIVQDAVAGESLDDYRNAMINAIQMQPQGGAKTDYMLWSSDAKGVRKVYPYLKENDAGTVQIFVEATKESSSDGNGTPTQTIIKNVEDVIELDPDETKPINQRGRKPIQAFTDVLPIKTVAIDLTISNLENQSDSEKNSIRSNFIAYLDNVRPFVDGAELQRNRNDSITVGKVQATIFDSIGANNTFQSVSFSVDGSLVTSYQFLKNEIPYLRNINYV